MGGAMQVSIHIQSKQRRAEVDTQPMVQVQDTTGVLTPTKDGFTLTYNEPDKSVGGTVTLTYSGSKLVLERKNVGRTIMVFTEGVSTDCDYHTPYGIIPLSVRTKKLGVRGGARTCSISLSYTLESAGLDTMELQFSLLAKNCER